MNQWSEAERFHQAALEVQPDHVATHVSYGTMLARNVSENESIDSHSILTPKTKMTLNTHTRIKYRISSLSLLYLQSSRTSEAELWFKRALKLAPYDSSVRHHYGKRLRQCDIQYT